jgi:hypothetical protein
MGNSERESGLGLNEEEANEGVQSKVTPILLEASGRELPVTTTNANKDDNPTGHGVTPIDPAKSPGGPGESRVGLDRFQLGLRH